MCRPPPVVMMEHLLSAAEQRNRRRRSTSASQAGALIWFQRRRYASAARRPGSHSERPNTTHVVSRHPRVCRQHERARSWKQAGGFHALPIKPITPASSEPWDIARSTHHVSLFPSSLYLFSAHLTVHNFFFFLVFFPPPPQSFSFPPMQGSPCSSSCVLWVSRRCLACLCTAAALLISPTSLSPLSPQCHQSGCRSADNPPARSALIRDKRCFLSRPAIGLGHGWDGALLWPGSPPSWIHPSKRELCRDSDPDPAAETLHTLVHASVS